MEINMKPKRDILGRFAPKKEDCLPLVEKQKTWSIQFGSVAPWYYRLWNVLTCPIRYILTGKINI
jgi:hypothetical protein